MPSNNPYEAPKIPVEPSRIRSIGPWWLKGPTPSVFVFAITFVLPMLVAIVTAMIAAALR